MEHKTAFAIMAVVDALTETNLLLAAVIERQGLESDPVIVERLKRATEVMNGINRALRQTMTPKPCLNYPMTTPWTRSGRLKRKRQLRASRMLFL